MRIVDPAWLARRVKELVSDISDVSVRLHNDVQTGVLVYTKDKRMAALFFDFGPYIMRKSAEQVAQQIAGEIRSNK